MKGEGLPLALFVFLSLLFHGGMIALVIRNASTGRMQLTIPEFIAVDVIEVEPKAATERTRDAASPRSAAPALEWRPDKAVDAFAKPVETSESQEKISSLELDTDEFPFVFYVNMIRNKISSNWDPPRTHGAGTDSIRTRVHFVIQHDGRVHRVVIEEGSGVPFFDQSALRAVYASDPLPPLPEEFSDTELGVHFSFEFVP